jgi:hypothetical protein
MVRIGGITADSHVGELRGRKVELPPRLERIQAAARHIPHDHDA